jgi:hypothetical protein
MCIKCYSKRRQHVQNHEWCQNQDLAGKLENISTKKILIQHQTLVHNNITIEKTEKGKNMYMSPFDIYTSNNLGKFQEEK